MPRPAISDQVPRPPRIGLVSTFLGTLGSLAFSTCTCFMAGASPRRTSGLFRSSMRFTRKRWALGSHLRRTESDRIRDTASLNEVYT
eukprot:2553578-Prymnesium_polylepis.1